MREILCGGWWVVGGSTACVPCVLGVDWECTGVYCRSVCVVRREYRGTYRGNREFLEFLVRFGAVMERQPV